MSEEGVVYWVTNRYDFSRKIFFFSDPLHLIKTIRNNFENSGGHSYTRNHMVSEASIFSLCITGQHQRFYLFVVTISTNLTYPCLTFNISCYRRDPHLAQHKLEMRVLMAVFNILNFFPGMFSWNRAIFFNRRWNLVFRGDHRREASDLMGVEEREYTKSIYTEVILDKNCIRL